MTSVGAVLWWIVLGGLLGWVGAWWLGRSTQRLLTEPVIQIVERTLDNPRHIARIAGLEGDVAALQGEAARIPTLEGEVATIPALQARIDELLAAPPRVVEKVVTRTVDRVIEKPVERIVEKVIEKPVDRIVERLVPDTAAIAARDAALSAQRHRVEHLDALAAVLADRLAQATAATTQSDALTQSGATSLSGATTQSEATPPSTAASPATSAATMASSVIAPVAAAATAPAVDALRPLRARIEHLEALAAVQADRLAEARNAAKAGATGFAVAGDADIEIVEGIGPRIAELLRARGLGSFGAIARSSPGTLREILDSNGPAYRIADPSTWPEQARLAADGRWDELKSLQDSLNAGRR